MNLLHSKKQLIQEIFETSSFVKYLGVFFDKNLNWETHSQFVMDKMCSAKQIQ